MHDRILVSNIQYLTRFPPPSILTLLSSPSLVPVPITVGSMGGIIPTLESNVR